MGNLFDYLTWRGDLTLQQVPLGAVDALALTTLAYLCFDGLIGEDATIFDAAAAYFSLDEAARRPRRRVENDEALLRAMAVSPRFGPLGLRLCRSVHSDEQETQFGAMTVLLPKGAFVAFRGTDNTLIGWKEDFNLGFLDTVPAQWHARDYLNEAAAAVPGPLWVGGHSKGGNLAVFAAAGCRARRRIRTVYNNDGPGFSPAVFQTREFRAIVPRVQTFLPESSVIGMLLDHEDDYTVVRSNQTGILQHDPYSWQISGGDFVRAADVTAGSRLIDSALRSWLADMAPPERAAFVDALYDALTEAGAENVEDFTDLRTVSAVLVNLIRTDHESGLLRDGLRRLRHAGLDAMRAMLKHKEVLP